MAVGGAGGNENQRQEKPPAWLRAVDAGLTAAGAALSPVTGGASGAAAAGKTAAKKIALSEAGKTAAKRVAASAAVDFVREHKQVIELAAGIAAALILAGSMALMAVFSAVAAAFSSPEAQGGYLSGEPGEAAGEIPAEFLQVFLAAQEEYKVSWAVLAAVAKTESGFGGGELYLAKNGVSEKGAVGFMQFMPTTWSGADNPRARNDPASPSWDANPQSIAAYGGYGVDGDGDGAADPFNPRDAIFSAANYLAASGFAEDPREALYRYNRSWDYVNEVLAVAAGYSAVMLPIGDGFWPLPPDFREVTSGFGWRVHPVTHLPEHHGGIDVAVPVGTPVLAAAPGTVSYAGRLAGYGLTVKVKHAGGAETLYGHLSEIYAARGQGVAAGQPLGATGSTGVSTGPHLHFGVYVNGKAVDPEEWLRETENGGSA